MSERNEVPVHTCRSLCRRTGSGLLTVCFRYLGQVRLLKLGTETFCASQAFGRHVQLTFSPTRAPPAPPPANHPRTTREPPANHPHTAQRKIRRAVTRRSFRGFTIVNIITTKRYLLMKYNIKSSRYDMSPSIHLYKHYVQTFPFLLIVFSFVLSNFEQHF
jgi:hypothetical protein